MIRRLLLVLALASTPALATTTQIIGTLVDATGTPVNGTACFKLPVNAIDTSTSRALSPRPFCYPMTNGTLPAFATVVPNDVIQPLNTYYQAKVTDKSGGLIFMANYVIPTGAGTFNIGLAIPTTVLTTNISFVNPGGLASTNTWTAFNTFASTVILQQSLSLASATGNIVGPSGLLYSSAVPTIASGFGTSPVLGPGNGTATFNIAVGTGGVATSGTINLLPAANNGWTCTATDVTTQSATVFVTKQIASTTTTATLANFNTAGAQAAWVANDILFVNCWGR